MSSVNVNLSVTNLPNIDRHQNDIHKNPIINQEQNAKIAHNELSRKLSMPVEAESTEGKKVDSSQRKDDLLKKKKSRKKNVTINKVQEKRKDEGFILDVDA